MTRDESSPVVVGVDGTEVSLKALDWAADRAVEAGCPLRIVHIPTGREPSASTVRLRVFGRLALRTGHRPTATIWRVRFGSRAEVLFEEAADARLLVLGHREPQPALGSTLRGVLTRGIERVVVIPAHWSRHATFGRVVVGVDRDTRPQLLNAAFEIASQRNSVLQVVHAVAMPHPQQGRSLLDEARHLEVKTKAELGVVLAGAMRNHDDVAVEISAIQGDPALLLTRAAQDADLLIIAGHPRHGLPTMAGSTTESIMKLATCPVIIVQPFAAQRRAHTDAA